MTPIQGMIIRIALAFLLAALAGCAQFKRDVDSVGISAAASDGKASVSTAVTFKLRDPRGLAK
jgi:hypothetical protein